MYLAYELKEGRNINVLGTVSKNRSDTPAEVKNFEKMENGDYSVYNVNGTGIKYIKLMDQTKPVLMITTLDHGSNIVEIIKKKFLSNELYYMKDVTCPQKLYTTFMHGVDCFDFLTAIITCRRRNSRWTFVVFEHLIDVSVVNVFTIVNSFNDNK